MKINFQQNKITYHHQQNFKANNVEHPFSQFKSYQPTATSKSQTTKPFVDKLLGLMMIGRVEDKTFKPSCEVNGTNLNIVLEANTNNIEDSVNKIKKMIVMPEISYENLDVQKTFLRNLKEFALNQNINDTDVLFSTTKDEFDKLVGEVTLEDIKTLHRNLLDKPKINLILN